MKRLTINLDQSWVLSHRTSDQLPTSAIAEALKERGLTVTTSGFAKVMVDVPDEISLEQIRAVVVEKLSQK